MAVIYIELKRLKEDNNNYFYSVTTTNFGGATFMIQINKETQEIYFFESENAAKPVMKYDLKTRSWHDYLPSNINEKVLPYVIIKSYKAIRDNNFSEYICYAA